MSHFRIVLIVSSILPSCAHPIGALIWILFSRQVAAHVAVPCHGVSGLDDSNPDGCSCGSGSCGNVT